MNDAFNDATERAGRNCHGLPALGVHSSFTAVFLDGDEPLSLARGETPVSSTVEGACVGYRLDAAP